MYNTHMQHKQKQPNRSVLQLTDYGAPYPGNFVASLTALEAALLQQGRGMYTMFPPRARERDWFPRLRAEHPGVTALEPGGFPFYFCQVRRLLRETGAGVLHVHFIHFREKLAAWLACKTCGHRVVTVCHLHNHLAIPKRFPKSLPQRLYIRMTDLFLCCSASVAARLRADGVPESKIAVAENAIAFSRLDAYAPVDRRALGLADGDRVALLFGFDFLRKGVDLAVDAVRLLREADGLPLTLAVSVSSGREAVEKAICRRLGLDALPGWIVLLPPRDDVAGYYRMADVFLSPSREEGFCYALVEAVYCETPVVASAIDAQRDLALPETAFFRPGDVADLAAHIRAALEAANAPGTQRALESAKARVTEAYSLSAWADAVAAQYDRLAP